MTESKYESLISDGDETFTIKDFVLKYATKQMRNTELFRRRGWPILAVRLNQMRKQSGLSVFRPVKA